MYVDMMSKHCKKQIPTTVLNAIIISGYRYIHVQLCHKYCLLASGVLNYSIYCIHVLKYLSNSSWKYYILQYSVTTPLFTSVNLLKCSQFLTVHKMYKSDLSNFLYTCSTLKCMEAINFRNIIKTSFYSQPTHRILLYNLWVIFKQSL